MIENKDCWLKESGCNRKHCADPSCLILYKLDYLYNKANVPLKLRKTISLRTDQDGTDVEEFKLLRSIQDNIVDFIKEGRQLYLHSKITGNGKSSWALRLLQTFFNKIWFKTELTCRGLFINVPYFLLALKENITSKSDYIEHIKQNALDCDVVIWDDIGNKIGTEFETTNLLSLIENRINSGKTNIFTSNLSNEELHMALGDRLASRICNLDYNIELHGGDKRSITFKEN